MLALSLIFTCGCRTSGKRVLRVGTSADTPPFTYYNNYGIPTGFDIKLMNALTKDMDYYKVEFVTMRFEELIEALEMGKVDCVISAMTVNEERKKFVSFSDVYYTSTQTVLARADGKVKKLESADEMKRLDVGVVEDSMADKFVTATVTKGKVVRRNSPYLAVNEVITGRCDLAVLETVSAGYYLENYSTYLVQVEGEVFDKKPFAIAVKKDNDELLQKFNDALAAYKASGELQTLVEENLIK